MSPVKISKFDPEKSYKGFDRSTAKKLAELIQQSYLQFEIAQLKQLFEDRRTIPEHPTATGVQTWKITENYELITELGTSKTPFGFVATDRENNIYVVFRGTKKIVEWFKDANIQLVSYADRMIVDEKVDIKKWQILENNIKFASDDICANIPNADGFGCVTAGFRGIYVSLRQQMIDALNTIFNTIDVNNIPQIYVTGHSLGGALATLAIPDILNNTIFTKDEIKDKIKDKITLYTFASPRCGDSTFAGKFEKQGVKHWRIANTEDFVTTLPFPTGNVFKPADPKTLPEEELGLGGVAGVDFNPNPIYGFFKAIYDRKKRRMPDYVHTGTPIYFTIHDKALERHHNLEEVYMEGISETALPPKDALKSLIYP
jgi:predicted lipase